MLESQFFSKNKDNGDPFLIVWSVFETYYFFDDNKLTTVYTCTHNHVHKDDKRFYFVTYFLLNEFSNEWNFGTLRR